MTKNNLDNIAGFIALLALLLWITRFINPTVLYVLVSIALVIKGFSFIVKRQIK